MGKVDVRVRVISRSIPVICTGRLPGGRGRGAGAEVGGGAVRGAIGVFSLLVSCDEVVLDGLVGEDGRGGRKFSVSDESDGGCCGADDRRIMGAGGGRFGMGNSSCAI